MIKTGMHKKALVVGAEVFSRILDWRDRGTCVLFGDGAGAVVLEASEHDGPSAGIVLCLGSLHADRQPMSDILYVPGQVAGGVVSGDPFLRMDGQAVFKLAVKVLDEVARETAGAVR